MSTAKPRPLERRYDILRLHGMAIKQIPISFSKLPLSTTVPWLDVSNEPHFDSKKYHKWAAQLGMALDRSTGSYSKVVACLKHTGDVMFCVLASGKGLVRAGRLSLGKTIWFPPYAFTANIGERSKQDKIEALIKYYFTDIGYASEFVDMDGISFQIFKLACNKIAEKLDELEVVQMLRKIERREAANSENGNTSLSLTNTDAHASIHTHTNYDAAAMGRAMEAVGTDEDEDTYSTSTQSLKRSKDDDLVQSKRLKSQDQMDSTTPDVHLNVIPAADNAESPNKPAESYIEEDSESEDSGEEEGEDEADRVGDFVYGLLQKLYRYDDVTALNKAVEAKQWWPELDPDSLL